jgi:hypothetical protein
MKCPHCVNGISPATRGLDHQDVRRFQISVDDGLLMRVLHPFASLNKEIESLADLELLLVAIFGNRQPGYVLHHKVGLALWRRSGVEYLGDGGMIHDRQRLPLGLEALQYGFVVHPGFDQLQSNLPPHRKDLICQPDLPHATFTELAENLKAFREDLP